MATNLELIQEFTIDDNTTNADIDNVFSDRYDVYQITLTNYNNKTDTGGNRTQIRFIYSAGNVETGASDYAYASLELRAGGAFVEHKSTGTSLIDDVNRVDTTASGNTNVIIYNPYSSGSYTFCQWQSATQSDPLTILGWKGIGVLKLAESMRGIRFVQVGNMGGDNIKCSVYGVK